MDDVVDIAVNQEVLEVAYGRHPVHELRSSCRERQGGPWPAQKTVRHLQGA